MVMGGLMMEIRRRGWLLLVGVRILMRGMRLRHRFLRPFVLGLRRREGSKWLVSGWGFDFVGLGVIAFFFPFCIFNIWTFTHGLLMADIDIVTYFALLADNLTDV
jgi:hypothetical protein